MSILILIVVLLVTFAVWQKENIKALFIGLTTSEEELSEKREENDKVISDALEKYPEISVRDLTEEEKSALLDGRITKEESLLIVQGKITLEELLGDSDDSSAETPPEEIPEDTPPEEVVPEPIKPEPPKEEDTPSTPPEEEVSPPSISPEEEIAGLIGEMYVLKSQFTAALKNLEDTSLKAYAELSEQEKKLQKADMMKKILDEVSSMEKDCDTKVKAILERLTTLLTETGKDLSLVESIKTAYYNEKAITKAEYINTYFK